VAPAGLGQGILGFGCVAIKRTGADAINISGLLNPKKLGNFKN